jgi:predicted small secreted protein
MITRNTVLNPLTVALLAAAMLLSGCATVSTVESDVQSFSAAPTPVQPGPFRFERLPSQDQDAGQAALLEGMAQKALEKAGFSRNDAAARFSVQIGAGTSEAVLAYPDPFYGRYAWSFGRPRLWHGRPFYTSPWPDRELYITRVRLEIRDLGNGKVVYESTATNEESWFNANRVLPALFEAVMADFPTPPKGVRKVIIKLPAP